MFIHRYFLEKCSDFDFGGLGKISNLWWSRSKNFLKPHMVNFPACLFIILFRYNSRKNRTVARKFWYSFELNRFVLHFKNCHRIVRNLCNGNFKNFIIFIFSIHFYWLKLARNFDKFLNSIHMICVPELVIVSSVYFLQSTSRIWIYLLISFNDSYWHEISVCF